jgi:ArsR family transcriptional regulator, arsenate/arsenite/antimonite-responsive transcriptional repressor
MDELIKILKAFGDKNRLRIVKLLQKKKLCVCEITEILGLATSTVSNHLSILKEADIISDVKDGKWVDYNLNIRTNNVFLNGLLPLLTFWLNNDAQVQADLEKLKTTNRQDLCKG